jgi:O-antigen ligase
LLEQSIRSATRTVWEARATRALFVLVLVSAISALLSVHRGNSLEAMLNLLAITGIFLAAMTSVRGMGMLRGIAFFEVLVAIPVATLGLLQHFRPELLPAANSYPGRALGPFGQPNRMGGYLIAMIPVALCLAWVAQDRALKAGLLLVSFGLVFCLAATYSRGAWLGLAAGLLVLAAAFARWPDLLPRPAMLGLAIACVALPFALLLPSVLSRVHSRPSSEPAWNLPIDPEREGSGSMRRAIWSGALRAAMSRPVFGWGIGSFRQAYDVSKDATMKRAHRGSGTQPLSRHSGGAWRTGSRRLRRSDRADAWRGGHGHGFRDAGDGTRSGSRPGRIRGGAPLPRARR